VFATEDKLLVIKQVPITNDKRLEIQNEIKINNRLKEKEHPNIVGYHGEKIFGDVALLTFQKCSMNLLELMKMKKENVIYGQPMFSETTFRNFSRQIAEGLVFLHEKFFAYCTET